MIELSNSKKFPILVFSLVILVLVQPMTAFAAEFCAGSSEIDSVPFFVDQVYLDIQKRPADANGQKFWGSHLEDLNSRMCRSANPAVLSSNCEWNNAAEVLEEILNSPESKSKNGEFNANPEFVTVLYRILLHRAPLEAGLKSHLAILNSGGSRASVISTFLVGEEYRKRFPCHEGAHMRAEGPPAGMTGRSGHTELGVNGHPITQPAYSDSTGVSYEDQLTQVQNLGAKWYRFDVSTAADFTKVDLLIKKAQAHGIQLLPVLFPPVDRAHDSPAIAYRKAYDGALSFVNRYKSAFHVYELSNELDIYSMSGGSGDQPTDYNPEKYPLAKELLRGLSEGVHAADGSAQRIINYGGWLHTGFFQRLENDGIRYEIVGIHWYQNMGEITCPGQPFPCPGRRVHFNVIQRLQTITHGKPMWVTETNYSPLASNSAEANMQRKEQYLPPTLTRYFNSPGVYPFDVVMIYELLDEPNLGKGGATQTQVGLISVARRADGGYTMGAPKPTFQSVQRVVKR